jgi:hypothetical protein
MFANSADKADIEIWEGNRGDLWPVLKAFDRTRRRGDVMWIVSNLVCDYDAAFTMAQKTHAPLSPMKNEVDYSHYMVCRGSDARFEGKYADYETKSIVQQAKSKQVVTKSKWDSQASKQPTGQRQSKRGHYNILLGGDLERNPGPKDVAKK